MQKIIDQDIDGITKADINWGKFNNKTVLVTGASGLLPFYIVATLLGLKERLGINCKVIALVRDLERAKVKFSKHTNQNLIFVDAKQDWRLEHHQNVSYIFHAASNASPVHYKADRLATIYPNTTGTFKLIELAKLNPIEGFLYFSSAEVYGVPNQPEVKIDEKCFYPIDTNTPKAVYAESKRLGEVLCFAARDELGIATQVVRPFHTYGPGMRLDDGRIFADIVRDILHDRVIKLSSAGKAVRSYCYVADATIAFLKVMLEGDGNPYNVGNPAATVSVVELANLMVKTFPERNIKIEMPRGEERNQDSSAVIPNIDRITALGWQPKIGISDGFKRTVESYEQ